MARRRHAAIAVGWLLVTLAAACAPTAGPESAPEEPTLRLTSPAFDAGGAIPREHSCDGEDRSPPLAWSEVPDGVVEFALVVSDPDARGFVHWVLTGIPGDARELPAGQGDAIGAPGPNDFGRTGWAGPCPPSGEHRYEFTLWALREPLETEPASADEVREMAARSAVGAATLTGVYRRDR